MDWWQTKNEQPYEHYRGACERFFRPWFKARANILVVVFLQTPTYNLYLGGDSAMIHFAEIGNKYGPFDLAILECGQYNTMWRHIHMMPEETAQAAIDLKAKVLLPVHWEKFTLAARLGRAYYKATATIKRVWAAGNNADDRRACFAEPALSFFAVVDVSIMFFFFSEPGFKTSWHRFLRAVPGGTDPGSHSCAFAHDLFSLCKHIDHLFINFFGRCVLRSSGIQTLAALMIFCCLPGE